ncbi:hypothetical protein C4K68_14155, partial [Pokkaliibacter plantistimulans]
MLWRRLFSKHDQQSPSATSDSPQLLGLALEPRMLFDGALAATAATSTDTTSATDTSSQTTDSTQNADSDNGSSQHTSQDTDSHDGSADLTDTAVAGDSTRREVVFIDTSVTDYQTLVDNVPAGMEVVLIDGSEDGLSQMVDWAETHSGY